MNPNSAPLPEPDRGLRKLTVFDRRVGVLGMGQTACRTEGRRRVNVFVATVVLALALSGMDVRTDTIKIRAIEPPKSFQFARGADVVEMTITVETDVVAPEGDTVALAVHDQKNRGVMTQAMPLMRVKEGHDSVVFRPTVQSLGSDVTALVVEAVLMTASRRGGAPQLGESRNVKLSFRVK